MKYISVEDDLRQSALRLEAKGLWQTDMGFDNHAQRSFRKAGRKRRMADAMAPDPCLPEGVIRSVAILAMSIANSVLSGNTLVNRLIITKK